MINITRQLWQFSLSSLVLVTLGLYGDRVFAASFTEDYAPGNFTLTNSNADGTIDTTNAASGSVLLFGGNNGSELGGTTDWAIPITSSRVGTWSFDWSYFSLDTPGNDTAGFIINSNFTPLTSTSGDSSSTPVTFTVTDGDVVGFRVATANNFGGAGEFTVSNFQVTPIPFEFSPALGLFGLGAFGIYRSIRKLGKKTG